MSSKLAGLAVLALALTASSCAAPPTSQEAAAAAVPSSSNPTPTGSCVTSNGQEYTLTMSAQLPAGDTRTPVLSWEDRPSEVPTTSTLQRDIRACDATSLSADFRTPDGGIGLPGDLQIKSETLTTAAGPIQVVSPADNKSLCGGDVSVSSAQGSCAEPRGWLLTFTDPKPGTFQLQSPVAFGTGIAPSTLTITGTVIQR